jgi:hypothetical protein
MNSFEIIHFFHNFLTLSFFQKVLILWCLCEWWLDVNYHSLEEYDEPDNLRTLCLGMDSQQNRYWYFGGFRLYREIPIFREISPPINRKRKPESPLKMPTKRIKLNLKSSIEEDKVENQEQKNLTNTKSGQESKRKSQRYDKDSLQIDSKFEMALFNRSIGTQNSPPLSVRRSKASISTDSLLLTSPSRRSIRLVSKELLEKSKKVDVKGRKENKKKRRKQSHVDEDETESEEEESVIESFQWEICCSSSQEWENFQSYLSSSKSQFDKQLYEKLSQKIFPFALESVRSQERAIEKRNLINSLPRKRSARIFQKVDVIISLIWSFLSSFSFFLTSSFLTSFLILIFLGNCSNSREIK